MEKYLAGKALAESGACFPFQPRGFSTGGEFLEMGFTTVFSLGLRRTDRWIVHSGVVAAGHFFPPHFSDFRSPIKNIKAVAVWDRLHREVIEKGLQT
jgi:hypothetical protein